MNIGCVSYLNALPFVLPFQYHYLPTTHRFVLDIPSVLNTQMRSGNLDLALTSCLESLEGGHRPLEGFCISSKERVLSVNLYARVPLSALNGVTIALTHHSKTSVALLKVLCHSFWKVTPHFTSLQREHPLETYEAFLLIGDEALEKKEIPGYFTYDLAEAWYVETGLPFVFALFSVRKGTDPARLIPVQQQLTCALDWSEKNLPLIEEEAYKRSRLPKTLLHEYYSLLNYRLGEKEKQALKTFYQLYTYVPTDGS